ncbi:orotidine-5'-phosphate decarboxylase [Microterricola viridarii]|uniref:Orotidine-5'-phosphate decarboxylase n=1 Tax=Microterricola viridarii TaxID=412690 RepID=A0A1H1U347_9MICO|nr:orotidine-5'-phosphate decarboxylase [Microterricola viridarii]SDS66857.1 orotidine-5'-phosphate decarboxylase [Microterricola viridarii]
MSQPEALTFGDKLGAVFDRSGHLCVGIDPHAWILDQWGLEDSAEGAREFGLRVVEAAWNRAGIVKPQVSFFERHGSAGYAALERVITEARAAGILVIADAKRGDIGSTQQAYGEAWLRPGSPLESDAVTLSPYLGLGSLQSSLELAEAAGKGVFVLAATSNPEAAGLQTARVAETERTVAASMLAGVAQWNGSRKDQSERRFGSVGVVLGATLELAKFGININEEPVGPAVPVLAPGFGHQGAEVSETRRLFGALTPGVIVSESRGLLSAGRDGIADAIARRAEEVEAKRG